MPTPMTTSRIVKVANFGAVIIALFAVIVTFWQLYKSSLETHRAFQNAEMVKVEAAEADRRAYEAMAAEARAELDRQMAVINALARDLQSSAKSGGIKFVQLNTQDRQLLENVKAAQDVLGQRMKALESAIMADPIKVLSLPLMRKDLDSLQDKSKGDIEAVRGELARLYGLIQWFIGLMFTIALGVFGLAIANIITGEKKKDAHRVYKESKSPPGAETPSAVTDDDESV